MPKIGPSPSPFSEPPQNWIQAEYLKRVQQSPEYLALEGSSATYGEQIAQLARIVQKYVPPQYQKQIIEQASQNFVGGSLPNVSADESSESYVQGLANVAATSGTGSEIAPIPFPPATPSDISAGNFANFMNGAGGFPSSNTLAALKAAITAASVQLRTVLLNYNGSASEQAQYNGIVSALYTQVLNLIQKGCANTNSPFAQLFNKWIVAGANPPSPNPQGDLATMFQIAAIQQAGAINVPPPPGSPPFPGAIFTTITNNLSTSSQNVFLTITGLDPMHSTPPTPCIIAFDSSGMPYYLDLGANGSLTAYSCQTGQSIGTYQLSPTPTPGQPTPFPTTISIGGQTLNCSPPLSALQQTANGSGLYLPYTNSGMISIACNQPASFAVDSTGKIVAPKIPYQPGVVMQQVEYTSPQSGNVDIDTTCVDAYQFNVAVGANGTDGVQSGGLSFANKQAIVNALSALGPPWSNLYDPVTGAVYSPAMAPGFPENYFAGTWASAFQSYFANNNTLTISAQEINAGNWTGTLLPSLDQNGNPQMTFTNGSQSVTLSIPVNNATALLGGTNTSVSNPAWGVLLPNGSPAAIIARDLAALIDTNTLPPPGSNVVVDQSYFSQQSANFYQSYSDSAMSGLNFCNEYAQLLHSYGDMAYTSPFSDEEGISGNVSYSSSDISSLAIVLGGPSATPAPPPPGPPAGTTNALIQALEQWASQHPGMVSRGASQAVISVIETLIGESTNGEIVLTPQEINRAIRTYSSSLSPPSIRALKAFAGTYTISG